MQDTYTSLELTCIDIPAVGFNCPSPATGGACEISFDSGYCASPVAASQQMKPSTRCLPSFDHPMDNQQGSDVALTFSPFKTGLTVGTDNSLEDGMPLSPFKDTLGLSPFKGSPFKMLEFSPFKDTVLSPLKSSTMNTGTLDHNGTDEWETFLSSYEDKLFDIDNLDENALAELLKSPQGKALAARSPIHSKLGAHVRKLHISPDKKNSGCNKILFNTSKVMEQNEFIDVCSVTSKQNKLQHQLAYVPVIEQPFIKAEPVETSEFSGYHGYNVLVATDMNKMNATPVKPNYHNVERMPIRKLAMKPIEPNPIPQKENFAPPIWPSKERLKFARAQFQKTLEKAVHNVQILQEKNQRAENDSRMEQDKYPQLKKALSRPSKSTRKVKVKTREFPNKEVAGTSLNTPTWNDEEQEETWVGPIPFKRHASQGFSDLSDMDDEDSDDDYIPERSAQPRKQKKNRSLAKRARYM
ncbi:hypothetical protein CHS0354_004860 [Potamilus streckersoni]|uniref:Uncharacterized protein n=1 Tax=Potamilus streckersoni TaxID=2493646 RepID=A0AAE0S901_9BIVA|nr:hypothetical protein CHS0354_004860 [Potamilus streckersoni]